MKVVLECEHCGEEGHTPEQCEIREANKVEGEGRISVQELHDALAVAISTGDGWRPVLLDMGEESGWWTHCDGFYAPNMDGVVGFTLMRGEEWDPRDL